jgi:hypothetical protein
MEKDVLYVATLEVCLWQKIAISAQITKKLVLYFLCLLVSNTVLAQDSTRARLYRAEMESIKISSKQIDTTYINCQYANNRLIPEAGLDCLPAWEKSKDSCIQKLYNLILRQHLLTKESKKDIKKMRKQWTKSKNIFTDGISSFYYRLEQKYARLDIANIHRYQRQELYTRHFDLLYQMLDELTYYEIEQFPLDGKRY